MRLFTKPVQAGIGLLFAYVLVACTGGGGGGSTASTATPTLALFAGNMGGPGNIDGAGATARFYRPNSVATDSAGNVYVSDPFNNNIRKITPDGVVSTLAGTPTGYGSTDGIGAAASFVNPSGVATDGAGNVYVTDSRTIRKITPSGAVSTLAGTAGMTGSADGIGPAARFSSLKGIATDSTGNVYVADAGNHTIRKITPTGSVSTLAGTPGVSGSADGSGAAASFSTKLEGVAVDSAGNVYVADFENHTIRKISPVGAVTTLAGSAGIAGSTDGIGAAASFYSPTGVATDSMGNVYVGDSSNHAIRKITPDGVVSTLAGTAGASGSTDALGAAARFNSPSGVAADNAGNVYVADTRNYVIRKITPDSMVSTLAGSPMVYGSTDATGAAARFESLAGIATDGAGNVYAADAGNQIVRKITPTGAVSTLAGLTGGAGSDDGTGAAARFYFPFGVATDSAGNVYVSEVGNYTIRKITPEGVVSTLAGSAGVSGSADGNGAAANFYFPTSLACDSAGNVYVVDNSTIRKITPTGEVATLAGAPGMNDSTDGTGSAARFDYPSGIATDSAGNIYVAELGSHTIRKVTPGGVVSTVAGYPGVYGSTDGTGAAARFFAPAGVAVDSTGNLYVADSWNHTIRKITPEGIVSTVVGVAGTAGFIPGALPGVLAYPMGVAISGTSLYITLYSGVAVVNNVP